MHAKRSDTYSSQWQKIKQTTLELEKKINEYPLENTANEEAERTHPKHQEPASTPPTSDS